MKVDIHIEGECKEITELVSTLTGRYRTDLARDHLNLNKTMTDFMYGKRVDIHEDN